jgi:two-component system chemotaxis response regulator CheY
MKMAQATIVKQGVLIADPTQNMASLIAAMLRGFGHQMVTEITEARAFSGALLRRSYALIIVDESLGASGPLATLRKLRSDPSHPNRFTPIIMVSAAPDIRSISEARDAGVSEFLRKPFSAADLQARIAGLDLKPRDFVIAPDYAGPDRRRRQVDIGPSDQRGEGPDGPEPTEN